MFATWRMRKRRASSSPRSALAGTGRCGCAHVGRASRPVRAKRVHTPSRSRSGSARAAVGPLPSTDPHPPGRRALPVAATAAAKSKCERGKVIMAAQRAGLSRGVAPGGVEPPRTDSKSVALSAELRGLRSSVAARTAKSKKRKVADGTRTHDHLDHNQGLYQLSYSHRARCSG
jgi:hypothetical protein